jgi:hypothetical protein
MDILGGCPYILYFLLAGIAFPARVGIFQVLLLSVAFEVYRKAYVI